MQETSYNMNKEDFLDIRNQLNFSINNSVMYAMLLLDSALIALSFWLISIGGVLPFLASQFILSFVFFRGFCILHEAGHEIATNSKRINTIIGHLASLLCFLPYFPWKFSHNEHHTWSGNIDKDPSLGLLNDEVKADQSSTYRKIRRKIITFSWGSWFPLLAMLQHVVFWTYPASLMKDYSKNKQKIFKSALSVGFLFITYYLLHAAFPESFNIYNLAFAILLFFVWVELINFPHHINMEVLDESSSVDKLKPWEQSRTTRSCYYPKFIAEFFMLNFNFHIEHHLFPKLPWYRLRKARNLVKQKLGDKYHEEIGFNWNLKHRKISSIDKCFLAHKAID